MTTPTRVWLVRRMLDGLPFPARRWQLLAQAELNGVDAVTHERLRRLPEREYANADDVAYALAHQVRPGR
jgi:hypothetical protein